MIIGITGTPGAGKGAVVEFLVREKGFTHYSARNFFAEQMERSGIQIDRDSMTAFANELRLKFGGRFVFDELYRRASESDTPAVIESIRSLGEAEALKEQGGILISIDADQNIRYERIHGRASALDKVTQEEFQQQEAREMRSDALHKQNIEKVMEMADFTIKNSTSKEDLFRQIEEILEKIS